MTIAIIGEFGNLLVLLSTSAPDIVFPRLNDPSFLLLLLSISILIFFMFCWKRNSNNIISKPAAIYIATA